MGLHRCLAVGVFSDMITRDAGLSGAYALSGLDIDRRCDGTVEEHGRHGEGKRVLHTGNDATGLRSNDVRW
jgi:hypothetical protein